MYVDDRLWSATYKRAKYKKNEISGGRVIEPLNIDGARPVFPHSAPTCTIWESIRHVKYSRNAVYLSKN